MMSVMKPMAQNARWCQVVDNLGLADARFDKASVSWMDSTVRSVMVMGRLLFQSLQLVELQRSLL